MKYTFKYTQLLLLTTVLVICSLALPLSASVLETGAKVHISSLHQIDHDLYAFAKRVIIDGTVNGDCVAGAETITINGHILHSGAFGCQSLNITGDIDGTMRVFAEEAVIDGNIGRSLVGMGASITLGRSATVGHDIQLAGERIKINGTVNGKFSRIKGKTIDITGHFKGDLEIQSGDITIGPSTVIEGNLTYLTPREDMIKISDGATIIGETVWEEAEDEDVESEDSILSATVIAISKGLAAFLLGIILLPLFRPYVVESCNQLRSRFALSFASGILFSIIWIFCLVLFFIVGLLVIIGSFAVTGDDPIAGIMLLIFAGPLLPLSAFVSMAGGIAFYTGTIIVGLSLGALITSRARNDLSQISIRELIIGLSIMTPPLILSFVIPTVISFLCILIMLAGAGALVLGVRQCRRGFSDIQSKGDATAIAVANINNDPEAPTTNQ